MRDRKLTSRRSRRRPGPPTEAAPSLGEPLDDPKGDGGDRFDRFYRRFSGMPVRGKEAPEP